MTTFFTLFQKNILRTFLCYLFELFVKFAQISEFMARVNY